MCSNSKDGIEINSPDELEDGQGREDAQVVTRIRPRKTWSDGAFRKFVGGLESRDPLIGAFKGHIKNEGFPDAATWGQMRFALRRGGANETAMIGARMAWQAFRKRDR